MKQTVRVWVVLSTTYVAKEKTVKLGKQRGVNVKLHNRADNKRLAEVQFFNVLLGGRVSKHGGQSLS